jgi:hypothetical protein
MDIKKTDGDLSEVKIYEELCQTDRMFAKWRQLTFAGYLAVLAAAVSIITSVGEHPHAMPLIPLFSLVFLIGVIFWYADLRTDRLTFLAVEAGQELETNTGVAGFFAKVHPPEQRGDQQRDNQRLLETRARHTWAARALFLFIPLLLLLASVLLPSVFHASDGSPFAPVWEYRVVSLQVPLTNGETQLNPLATNGWMIVSHSTTPPPAPAPYCTVILKRPK